MTSNTKIASALLWALGLARDHGGATAALAALGIALPAVERFEGASAEFGDLLGRPASEESAREAIALGVLAGRVADLRPRMRRLHDPTSFVLDRELVVQAAEGQSVMRLPWVEEGLFVGRQLSEITEMPAPVRKLCIEHCTAALAGERRRFAFTSFGHAYRVDVVPVRGEDGSVMEVLAIATPERSFGPTATAYARTADRLERSASLAEQRAERYRDAGRGDAEAAARRAARGSRQGAERARLNARRMHSRDGPTPADAPSITSRQAEVLSLASYGLTSGEIAEQLGVSVATVKTHFDNIYSRLGVSDKAAAVADALRHGLIE